MNTHTLYTIGHSSHSQEEFLNLLQAHGVDCVVDVRIVPASKYTPQFNKYELKSFLNSHGVTYLHFGDEFGARRTDCLDNEGQVNFEQAVNTKLFQQGVARLTKGLEKGYHISLMCSEADPLECHRFSLVSRYFHDHGYNVIHILKDATTATHSELEKTMIDAYRHSRKYHIPEIDQLFGSYTSADQIRDAYRYKNKESSYRQTTDNNHHYRLYYRM